MREALKAEQIPAHEDDFSRYISDEVLLVGSMAVADVQVEERRLEEARVAALQGTSLRFIIDQMCVEETEQEP